jgi:hypothetical protein
MKKRITYTLKAKRGKERKKMKKAYRINGRIINIPHSRSSIDILPEKFTNSVDILSDRDYCAPCKGYGLVR